MKLFQSRKKSAPPKARAQLRAQSAPFGLANQYFPLTEGNIACYRAVRETVPIVDAAIGKIIRLCGGFHAQSPNPTVEYQLNRFINTVNVGKGQRGLQSFVDAYLDSMLTCGRAVGEIVPIGNQDIAAVFCGDVSTIVIREGKSPLDFLLCRYVGGQVVPFPYQNLLLFTPYAVESDHPYGVSLLRSMPYMVQLLLTIYNSMEQNFQRSGALRYAVTYQPGNDILDRNNSAENLQQIAHEWSSAMQNTKNGAIRDFVAMGNIGIQTIGADAQMPDTTGPVRQILEQLVSKTGIPPFMLGLSWSSTERMSAQQADVMTSEITAVRRALTPVLERICNLWLAMHAFPDDYEIIWDDINLQDQVEEARAGLLLAQTSQLTNPPQEDTP